LLRENEVAWQTAEKKTEKAAVDQVRRNHVRKACRGFRFEDSPPETAAVTFKGRAKTVEDGQRDEIESRRQEGRARREAKRLKEPWVPEGRGPSQGIEKKVFVKPEYRRTCALAALSRPKTHLKRNADVKRRCSFQQRDTL